MNRKTPMVSFLVMTLMMMAVSQGMARDYGINENLKSSFERADTNAAPEQVDPIFGYQLILSEETASVDYCESEGLSYTLTLEPGACVEYPDFVAIEPADYLSPDDSEPPAAVAFAYSFKRDHIFSESWLC